MQTRESNDFMMKEHLEYLNKKEKTKQLREQIKNMKADEDDDDKCSSSQMTVSEA
jgi:hypothetical protein